MALRPALFLAVALLGILGRAAQVEAFTPGPQPKYFREAAAGPHYDRRYARWTLEDDETRDALRVLMQTYLATFQQLGVETWLMHGTLLGWWWGKKILPWDVDADVQVSESDMEFLAKYYNMTVYFYEYEAIPEGRFFLLDINPNFRYRELDDWQNVIDARWVDMETGLYVDITAARYSENVAEHGAMMFDKSGHWFRDTHLYPLLDTTFEGVPAQIPYHYEKMLASEYSEAALTSKQYGTHEFLDQSMTWVPLGRSSLE